MKRIITFMMVLMAFVTSAKAQKTNLSPSAKMKAFEISNSKSTGNDIAAFVTLRDGMESKALNAYGVKVNSKVGKIMTVTIPAERYNEFVSSGLCSNIDLGYKVKLHNNTIREDLGIDGIYHGLNLPHGYDGSGVVVGIVDVGFMYGHPMFYDTTGSELRIKRVWQQSDQFGTHPAGFSYGRELTTPEEMLEAVTDNEKQGHGSHVAGIAAGSGAPDGNGHQYRGIAPGADLVLVGCNMTSVGIYDGLNYIHKYARSVGKPCVINMSLGSILGPHDGTDMYTKAVEQYLNNGRLDSIVVMVSAGNDGSFKRHWHHHFTNNDTLAQTYLEYLDQEKLQFSADIWGDPGVKFSVNIQYYNRESDSVLTFIDETGFVPSYINSMGTISTFTSPRDSSFNFAFFVDSANANNGRSNITVVSYECNRIDSADVFALVFRCDSGDVHLWNTYHNLVSNGNPLYSDGDDIMTIGGMGTDGNAVICVGSYATRTTREDADGNEVSITTTEDKGLSFFSSRGPSWNGNVKPDICSPGEYIVSTLSTPYAPYYPADRTFDSTVFNGETYYYTLMRGTSMSAPSATGVVALWLQANPSLSVRDVRTILHNTARQDSHTGVIPPTGDNNWGWGKINALAGLRLGPLAIDNVPGDDAIIYAKERSIYVTADEGVIVRIVDMMGRQLVNQPLHANASFRMPAAGVYLVLVGNNPARKIVVR